jgi:Spy/CpxP family protein refolding chaperone
MLLTLGQAAISQENWATKWIEEYQITSEQVTQLGAIENQYSDQIDQRSQELKQAERELTDLMVSTASATQIQEREREFEALQIQAAQLYFDKFLAIRDVLTLEQRLQLDKFRNVERS